MPILYIVWFVLIWRPSLDCFALLVCFCVRLFGSVLGGWGLPCLGRVPSFGLGLPPLVGSASVCRVFCGWSLSFSTFLFFFFFYNQLTCNIACNIACNCDKVTLPPATTGRPVRVQASQCTPRVRGG